MGGGQVTCGTFEGFDKSASPIQSVLSVVFERSFGRRPRKGLRLRLARLLSTQAADLPFERLIEDLDRESLVHIQPELASRLLPAVTAYYDHLRERLGNPDPIEAPEIDRERGVDMVKAKWGLVLGEGWHYHCLHDLVLALKQSTKTNTPVDIEISP